VLFDGDRKEVGVPFLCPLLEAAIICDTLRRHDKMAGDRPTRVYIRRKTWSKIPGAALLTLVDETTGKVRLNPKLFPGAIEPEPVAPPDGLYLT